MDIHWRFVAKFHLKPGEQKEGGRRIGSWEIKKILLTCMLLYLLKVLLHMEQANCIGPTRICAGVGIQNLLSVLKEYPWKLVFVGSWSSLKLKDLFWASESPVLLGNPMCKATVTFSNFSSLIPALSFWTPKSSSFKGFVSVNLLRRGKHWVVSWANSCCCW